ncbi:cytochrome c oxidase assembly protein [Agrococcus sp. Marseille-Q4369]|uniref:cytochrome c oxidase assembly protein n=1 Tax=Agrococcus sp. Marseille-Q4369 TaxID=2810513 RepID=UPI001B8CA353|nr:cytochrome c oxidase assembly protein [Agrococcus sp. Marseille-Q4369]QUW18178.1 cytochrome c oxidase assembly protein [Agrococcus sp. Marseille-Q4369]
MSAADAVGLAPPSFDQFLLAVSSSVPVLPTISVLLAIVYVAGVVRLRRHGHRWPWLRTACFLLACLLMAVVTGAGVDAYGRLMFSIFMFQQLALMVVIAPLLVLGSPGTLLLRATPHRGLGNTVLRVALCGLRSRAARFALHPALVIPLMLLSFFGLYVGGIADMVLRFWFGHILLEVVFLIVGILITAPLVSSDPLPRRTSYPSRMFDVFLEMQVHAAFGLVMLFSATPVVPYFAAAAPESWEVDPVRDQGVAGILAWTFGELPLLAMLIVTLARWRRQDTRQAGRDQRRADEDTEAYNEYLRQMQQRAQGSDADRQS